MLGKAVHYRIMYLNPRVPQRSPVQGVEVSGVDGGSVAYRDQRG